MARLRIETVPEITVKDEAFVIKAASGATAPLIQFKNSAGTVVGSLTITGELSIDSLAVSNAGSGSGSLATRGYVDSLAAGLNWHDSVAYATAAVLPASTYSNGTLGVGATLTGNANGRLTVDGSSQTTGESILVKNQATATQNGIYLITAQGDSSNPFILTRRTDSNNSIVGQVSSGDSVYVVSGSTNGGQGFTLTSVGTGTAGVIIFGTDSLTFTQFTGTSAFVSGAGLATTGNTINIGTASSSRIIINEDNIDLATVEQTNTSGSSTTSFINAITVDSYGRITGKQSSSVSFAGYALLASPTFTGTVTIPSGASISGFAPLASPTFTGTVTVPTPTSNTDAATKAYVDSGVASATTDTLNDVGDVTITSPAAGQTIQWTGSAWVNVTPTGTTVTTTANRSTDIPSPFTGQLIVLTDTKKVQLWDGTAWLNITLAPPETPTSLSATALSTTSVSIAFTAGGANGSPITNYKYALSTNGGSTYGSFTALSPEDITTPITISGLTAGTTYYIKLKAVNDMGDSVASAAVSISTLAVPEAPTSLSAGSITYNSVAISFTPGAQGSSAITNYQYALSTNSGSTYGSFTALNPTDASSPITITGLTASTAYYIKIKAVNTDGAGAESSAVSFTTSAPPALTVDYLVVAGAGGGGSQLGGGGGSGGLRGSFDVTGGGGALGSALSLTSSTNYSTTIGGGGAGAVGSSQLGANGQGSSFSSISTTGGGGGSSASYDAPPTGPGGGGHGNASGNNSGAAGTSNQSFAGGAGINSGTYNAGGGGGAGGAGGGASTNNGGNGGIGVQSSITGTATYYGGGGGGGAGLFAGAGATAGSGGLGGGGAGINNNGTAVSGTNNRGSGGGGGGQNGSIGIGGNGGTGVVILRYPDAYTITVGAGLTASHTNEVIAGGYKYTRITAGTGNVSWA